MIALSLFVVLLAIYTGTIIVCNLVKPKRPYALALNIALGIGLGLGLSSAIFFALCLMGMSCQSAAFGTQMALVLVSAILSFHYAPWQRMKFILPKRPPTSPPTPRASDQALDQTPDQMLDRVLNQSENGQRKKLATGILLAALVLASLAMCLSFVSLSLQKPHGEFDALAVWNLRARFLALTPHWQDAFSPLLAQSHPDYPALLPGIIAQSWLVGGDLFVSIPILVAFMFMIATLAVVGFGLLRLKNAGAALVGCLLLMATPGFVGVAALQYADMPLAFYITASVTCLLIAFLAEPGDFEAYLILSGIFAGLAAWTKNEGALYLCTFALIGVIACLKRGGKSRAVDLLVPLLLPALPAVLLLAAFKLQVNVPSELFANQTAGEVLARFFDIGRWASVLVTTAQSLAEQQSWLLGTLLFLVVYLIALPAKQQAASNWLLRAPACAAAVLWVLYLAVFVVAPLNIGWLIPTTVSRLFIQILPLLIIAFCLCADLPDLSSSKQPAQVA